MTDPRPESEDSESFHVGIVAQSGALTPVETAASTSTGVGAEPIVWTLGRQWTPNPTTLALGGGLAVVLVGLFLFFYLTTRARLRMVGRLGLWSLRVAALSVLVWMLFGWSWARRATDRADLVVAVDVSQSMGTPATAEAADTSSAESRLAVATSLLFGRSGADDRPARAGLWPELRSRYRTSVSLIGQTARPMQDGAAGHTGGLSPGQTGPAGPTPRAEPSALTATDPASRLAENLATLLDARRGRPTAAAVVFTDGIITEGMSWEAFASIARDRGVPLFVVAVGDDRPRRDLKLLRIAAEPVVFRGDPLTVEASLRATGCAGQTVRVTVRRGPRPDYADQSIEGGTGPAIASGEVLAEERVTFVLDDEERAVRMTFRPDREGEFAYHVSLEPVTPATALVDETPEDDVRGAWCSSATIPSESSSSRAGRAGNSGTSRHCSSGRSARTARANGPLPSRRCSRTPTATTSRPTRPPGSYRRAGRARSRPSTSSSFPTSTRTCSGRTGWSRSETS